MAGTFRLYFPLFWRSVLTLSESDCSELIQEKKTSVSCNGQGEKDKPRNGWKLLLILERELREG